MKPSKKDRVNSVLFRSEAIKIVECSEYPYNPVEL